MSRITDRRQKAHSQGGGVLVEVALIFPLILLLVFVGIDLALTLRATQIASTISRETASLAYRECNGDRGNKLEACLAAAADEILQTLGDIAGSSEVILSVYRVDGASAEARTVKTPASLEVSRFSLSEDSPPDIVGIPEEALNSGSGNFLADHELVVISEAFIAYESLALGLKKYIGLETEKLYDATIM